MAALCALWTSAPCFSSAAPLSVTVFPRTDLRPDVFFASGVRVNPLNPDELFVVVNYKFLKGTRGAGGAWTWREIGEGLPDARGASDFYMADRAIAFHPAIPGRMMIGGSRGGFAGVPYQSDDGGLSWVPLNICEHGPSPGNQNYKYSAMANYGLYSPTDPDTVYFGTASQSLCQGIFVSHDGGRTILPNPHCPLYDTECGKDPRHAPPYCIYNKRYQPAPKCASAFDSDVLLDVNPADGAELFGNDAHQNFGLISDPDAYVTQWGILDSSSGQVCASSNVKVDFPEGCFPMHGFPRYMEDGSVWAVNGPFEIGCSVHPGGRCEAQCAPPGATRCHVPAALVRFDRDEAGFKLFRWIADLDNLYSSPKVQWLPNDIVLFLDSHDRATALEGYDLQYQRLLRFDPGAPDLQISSFDVVRNPDATYDAYYLKSDIHSGARYAKLMRVRIAAADPLPAPEVLKDFEDVFTGVANFYADDALYVGTVDYFHFFISRDGGATFETRKGRWSTAFLRYLKTRDGLHFIDVNGGGLARITLDTDRDASPPAPVFRVNSMQWTDQAFPYSAMCTSNYLDVAADPKSPPGELWVWTATDAGVWRNKMFAHANDERACYGGDPDSPSCVWPCWDLVSGGYDCAHPPCGDKPGQIPSKDFANYSTRLVFDPRDPEDRTVYVGAKSGLWKGVESAQTRHPVCENRITHAPLDGSDVGFTRVFSQEPVRDVMVAGPDVFAAGSAGLYRSGDDARWVKVHDGAVSAMSAGDLPRRPIVIATTSLWMSEDSGNTWTLLLTPESRELPIRQIQVHREGGTDFVYFLTSDGVLKKVPAAACPFPDDPPGRFAALTGEHSVALSWDPVPSAGAFDVLRAEGQGAPAVLARVSRSGYLDETVQAGHDYSYSVRAVFSDTCSGFPSPSIAVNIPGAPTELK